MGNILTINQYLEEIVRLCQEEKKSVEESIRIVKGYCSTDQDKNNNHTKTFNHIIAPGQDIDNNPEYDIKTGKTIKELE